MSRLLTCLYESIDKWHLVATESRAQGTVGSAHWFARKTVELRMLLRRFRCKFMGVVNG